MPYQVVPPLVIIVGCFTVMGAGLGAVNKWQFRGVQKKIQGRDEWDRKMDARDKRLQEYSILRERSAST